MDRLGGLPSDVENTAPGGEVVGLLGILNTDVVQAVQNSLGSQYLNFICLK